MRDKEERKRKERREGRERKREREKERKREREKERAQERLLAAFITKRIKANLIGHYACTMQEEGIVKKKREQPNK